MKPGRFLGTVMAGGAAAALVLVVRRRRLGRLRYDRALAALRLLGRGGARYAGSAPRLFAAAGEQRQLLREDLALQTAEDVAADLRNVALLRRMLKITAPAQDVDALLTELRDRVTEELDYRREAANQRLLAAYYDGHPTIHIPAVISELSTRRVMTSELSGGARFAELASWPQHERDLAAETIYRFVFRSLYEVRAFNGDPHPGNYLFHPGGRVTFLDFGLVKHFTPAELQPLLQMVRTICVEHDPEAFRRSLENARFLRPHAPLSTQAIIEHLAVFYDTIREPGP
jgi:hypothetical protein